MEDEGDEGNGGSVVDVVGDDDEVEGSADAEVAVAIVEKVL